MNINVPQWAEREFWDEPPADAWEFWSFRFPPPCKVGDPLGERKKACRCNCGYRCGGPGRCKLSPMECLRQDDGKHYVRDCDHQWDGPSEDTHHFGGAVSSSVTCSKCGMSCMSHDMRYGA